MMILKTLSLSCLIVVVLSACTSTPDVTSQVAPGSDFRAIQTYGFISEASTNKGGYESIETNYLKEAVAQQLDKRGLRQKSENPDVVMNFYIVTDEKIKARQVPSMYGGGYYGPGFYDGFGPVGTTYETHIDQYTEGTLIIDMIDPRQRKLLWEGTVTGRLTKKDKKNLRATVNDAVNDIFTMFPVLDSELARQQ